MDERSLEDAVVAIRHAEVVHPIIGVHDAVEGFIPELKNTTY